MWQRRRVPAKMTDDDSMGGAVDMLLLCVLTVMILTIDDH